MTDCEKFKGRQRDLCEGRGRDGRKNPPTYAIKAFREQHGITDTPAWNVSQPSRGIGDTIAKFTHATGIAQAVDYVAEKLTGKPGGCGCAKRQSALNEMIPFQEPQ